MLHAKRVSLILACFVVHKIGFKGGQKCPAADFMLEAEKRGTPLDCRKSGDFFGAKGSGEGINPFLRKRKD